MNCSSNFGKKACIIVYKACSMNNIFLPSFLASLWRWSVVTSRNTYLSDHLIVPLLGWYCLAFELVRKSYLVRLFAFWSITSIGENCRVGYGAQLVFWYLGEAVPWWVGNRSAFGHHNFFLGSWFFCKPAFFLLSSTGCWQRLGQSPLRPTTVHIRPPSFGRWPVLP